jgi:phosphoribosylformimino-5-aminoimidazole carboxamide ribotide isomerase
VSVLRIIPAIDIRAGKCVRLIQGDYDRETVFGDDPGEMARRWLDAGADSLHIVDLDGARDGGAVNRVAVDSILKVVSDCGRSVAVDLGGGIRTIDDAAGWLEGGVGAIVLGTVAVTDPDMVTEAASRFPGRVWVGIDSHDGEVKTAGWMKGSGIETADLARDMQKRGAAGVIFTDIDRDGTGKGVNVDATTELAVAINIPVIASGGVDSVRDIQLLKVQAVTGIDGVIVGRALYDGTVTLAALLEAAR